MLRSRSFLIALLVVFALYFPTVREFPTVWDNNRSYGFLAAAFCIWMLWKDRQSLQWQPARQTQTVLIALLLSLAWFVALVVSIQVVQMALLPFILLTWIWCVSGEESGRTMRPVAGMFLLAVPLWEVLLGPLQAMTVAVNGLLVRVSGIKAALDGQQIRFPSGTIEVAQSCAGLSYFMSALTISVIYARMNIVNTAVRIRVIGIALIFAVVSNWFRVFGLIVVGYRSEMQSPLMEEHGTYGWIIFSIAILGFFSLTRLYERWDSRTPSLPQPDAPATPAISTTPVAVTRSGWQYIAWASAAAVTGPLLYFGVDTLPRPQAETDTAIGITPPANWTVASRLVVSGTPPDTTSDTRWQPLYAGASEHIVEQWTDSFHTVQVDRLIYDSQSQDAELIGGGNTIASGGDVANEGYAGPLDDNFRSVRQAVVRTAAGPRLVWYWYRVSGIETPRAEKAKLLELVAFISRGPPSELIAVSTPCQPNSCQEAAATTFRFVTGRELPPRSN